MRITWGTFALLSIVALPVASCCKTQQSEDKKVEPPVTTPASTSPLPAPPPTQPSAALDFSGTPSSEIKFLTYKPLRWNAVQFGCPVGWLGSDEYYDGLVQLWSKDEAARFTINALGTPKIGEAQVELWTRNLGGKDVRYGARTETKVGKKSMLATVAEGKGLLNKAPARFWVFDVDVMPGKKLLIVAGLKDSAAPERLQELIAAIRSIYKA